MACLQGASWQLHGSRGRGFRQAVPRKCDIQRGTGPKDGGCPDVWACTESMRGMQGAGYQTDAQQSEEWPVPCVPRTQEALQEHAGLLMMAAGLACVQLANRRFRLRLLRRLLGR